MNMLNMNPIFFKHSLVEIVPKHLVHSFISESISIVHKSETSFSFDHGLIDPELLSTDIRVIGIVCQMTRC